MKTLFLVFYGFQEYNGISKKIRYQADALRLCGTDVRTCHYEVGNDGSRKWMIDEDVLADLGKGIPAKIKKRLSFAPILQLQSAKPPVHLFKTKRFYFEVLFQNEASLLEQNQTAFKWTSNPI